jgi:hypothetical protein
VAVNGVFGMFVQDPVTQLLPLTPLVALREQVQLVSKRKVQFAWDEGHVREE